MEKKDGKKRKWVDKWRSKYRLVFITDDTLEERFTFRLSRMNVFVALGTLAIILIFLTTILIAFTPLREYIPGYSNVDLTRRLYRMQVVTDSIEKSLAAKDRFIQNIRDVIEGNDLTGKTPVLKDSVKRYDHIRLKRSVEDSLLRIEIENQSRYNLNRLITSENATPKKASLGGLLFFTPLKGVITSHFDALKHHYGIDIVARENETVKSVLDGTVLLTNRTLETGYVIVIQHSGNIVSVYRHNAALLKKAGDLVRAGEPVAIVGNTGETSQGVHLHFELWSDGNPVDPQNYISF